MPFPTMYYTIGVMAFSLLASLLALAWVMRAGRNSWQTLKQSIYGALLLKIISDILVIIFVSLPGATDITGLYNPFKSSMNIVISTNTLLAMWVNFEILTVFQSIDERITDRFVSRLRIGFVLLFTACVLPKVYCMVLNDSCLALARLLTTTLQLVFSMVSIVMDNIQAFYLAWKTVQLKKPSSSTTKLQSTQSIKRIVLTNVSICLLDYLAIGLTLFGMMGTLDTTQYISATCTCLSGLHVTALVLVLRNLRLHIKLGQKKPKQPAQEPTVKEPMSPTEQTNTPFLQTQRLE